MKQPALPHNAASGSGSSEESDFVKVKQQHHQQGHRGQHDNNNQDDEELFELEEEEEEEETPLSLKTHALLDIIESTTDFFDEALPQLDVDRIAKEQSQQKEGESFPPLLSITYIDKNIYEAKDYIPFLCDLVELFVEKFELYREFAKNIPKENDTDDHHDIYFGSNGTCFVEITGCDLGPENTATLSERLFPAISRGCKPNGPNLTLRLDNNRMLKTGFDSLSAAIISPSNNLRLVLKDFSIRENSIRDDSMPQLCRVLHVCPFLEELTIGTSHIFPTGIRILVDQGIETSPYVYKTLKALNIEFNTLGNEGMIVLAKALSKCYALEKLNISDNSISDEGAVAIADMLLPASGNCGPLRWIDMSVNQIGEIGARAIAESLEKKNSRIEHLDIGCNPIGPDGGEALCRAAKYASRLITLDLTTTDLTEKAGRLLVEALQHRANVFKEAFIFECNNLSFEVRKKVAEMMNSRRRLVVAVDEEIPQGMNLKTFGSVRQIEVDQKRQKHEEAVKQLMTKTNRDAANDAINWPLIACVLGMSGVAIWYLLKPKQNQY